MGPKSSKIGLATKAGDFDEALVSHLSELLDQEDDTPLQLDWRTLAQRMGLKDESRQRLARTEKKTKTALRLWSYEEPENSTARELVRILLDMGRRDAALAVQSHLAERYEPGRSPLEDQFQEVDTAARFGQLEEVTRLVGDKLGPEVEEVFQACPSILWSPLHTASEFGHLPVVRFLVEKKFNVFMKNHQGKTPREVAVAKTQRKVSAFLERAETGYVPAEPTSNPGGVTSEYLIGQILTVYSSDENQLPVDIPIESQQLEDVVAAASTQLRIQVDHFINARTRARISSVADFRHIRQVVAIPVDARHDDDGDVKRRSPVPSVTEGRVVDSRIKESEGPRRVLLYAFNEFWSQSPQSLEFKLDEEFVSVLKRASEKVGYEVVQLLTCDKLSRIPSCQVLAHKSRVIALDAHNERVSPEERRALVSLQYIGETVEKEFTRAGGTVFSPSHGVLVTIPKGAVKEGDRVTVTVRVALPARRMDLGDDATTFRPIGHPVVIESNPSGYQFQQTTSLRLPHCGAVEENVNAPIAVFAAPTSAGQEIVFRKLPDQLVRAQPHYVTVLLSKFSWFWAFAPRTVNSRQYAVSVFSPTDENAKHTDAIQFKAFIYPALHVYYEGAVQLVRSDTESKNWILRGRQTFPSLPHHQIHVSSEASDPGIWKTTPPSQAFELHEAWNVLYASDQPSDLFIFKTRAVRPEKRNDKPANIKLSLKEGPERCLISLGIFVDLPSFGPGSDFSLPSQLKEEISHLMDGTEVRGWRDLAHLLGVNPREVETEARPTLAILKRFEWRHGTKAELQDAVAYLGHSALPD